jgi:hypothetical protein
LTSSHFVKPCKVCHAILLSASAAEMCRSRSVTPNLLRLIGALTNCTVGLAISHDINSIRYSPFAAVPVGAAIAAEKKGDGSCALLKRTGKGLCGACVPTDALGRQL